MNAIFRVATATSFLCLLSLNVSAHQGHGESGPSHIMDPQHFLPMTLMIGSALAVFAYQAARSQQSHD